MNRQDDKSIRVLFVEDDDRYASCVSTLGSADAYSVERAVRLDDALARIRATQFDVILTDLTLPDSQGLDVVEQLRDSAPALPIVLFTSAESEAVKDGARGLGVGTFIEKPAADAPSIVGELTVALERALNERRFRNIVASTVDAAVVVGTDGLVLYANSAAEELFALPQSALIGSPFGYSLTNTSDEIQINREDSEPRVAEIRTVEFRWNGAPAYLASIRDITERRRAEKLRRTVNEADRKAAMGQLASAVAHDINNPVAVLQSNLGVLSAEARSLIGTFDTLRERLAALLGPEAAKLFDRLAEGEHLEARLDAVSGICSDSLAATKRIGDTTRELRSVAQLEPDELERCDLNDVIRAACGLTDREMSTNARLHFELGSLPQIQVHRDRMTQVFVSLLLNAAEAVARLPEGGSIRIISRYNDGSIEILVKDTGCGLSDSRQSQLFAPNFANGRAQESGPLALAAETVRRHRGSLTCSSELGVGTCLTVQIPIEADVASIGRRARRGSILTRASYRVLLIDDEPMLRRAVRRVIEPPHTVVEAEDGADALSKLEEDSSFDVILCDLTMPRIDGPAFYDKLSEAHPHLLERLVFVSGGTVHRDVEDFLAIEEPTVLEKPVSRDLLLGIIDRIGGCSKASAPAEQTDQVVVD